MCLCDMGVVEDGFHVWFHCPVYSELRNHLFGIIQLKDPDLFWLSLLFREEIFVIARFIENEDTENSLQHN